MSKFRYLFLIPLFVLFACSMNTGQPREFANKEESLNDPLTILRSWGYNLPSKMESIISNKITPESSAERQAKNVQFNLLTGRYSTSESWIGLEITFQKEKIFDSLRDSLKKFKFEDGRLVEVYQKIEVFREPALYPVKFGYYYKFKENHLEEVSCYHQVERYGEKCDDSIFLNLDGSIREVKPNKAKCNKGCGQFQPLRQPGDYYITSDKVRVRETPSTKGKIVSELSKDTKVEVTADAETYDKISPHFATWAKVKLDDGKEGYVYGAFLRAPGEPDVVAIKEKAEAWKKENLGKK